MPDGSPMLDLGLPARQVKKVLNGVTDDQLSAPTPCEGFTVATLLDHFMGLTIAFTLAARKSTKRPAGEGGASSGPPQASAEHLDPEWRRKLPVQLDELVAAWKAPAAWQGVTEAGGVTLPAEVMGIVAVDELVIHGWDLARATGQDFECDDTNAEAIIGLLSQSADARGEGAGFDPVVDVPADAPLLDRAVGVSGRDPAWKP